MDLASIANYIQDLPISAAMRGETQSTIWIFPIVETIHILSFTIVFGSISMVDLRLLGWSANDQSITKIAAETLPWTWAAWCLAAVSGALMFTAKAVTYSFNFQFRMKFVCMALAAINMMVFQFSTYKSAATWDTSPKPPIAARLAGALSVAFWLAVIFFGRWIGFKT
jgi:hypothetical protein